MTLFIQLWESRRVPDSVVKLIPKYNGQDVLFIPENSSQNFVIDGEIDSKVLIEMDQLINGFNYTLSSGTLIIGKDLKVILN